MWEWTLSRGRFTSSVECRRATLDLACALCPRHIAQKAHELSGRLCSERPLPDDVCPGHSQLCSNLTVRGSHAIRMDVLSVFAYRCWRVRGLGGLSTVPGGPGGSRCKRAVLARSLFLGLLGQRALTVFGPSHCRQDSPSWHFIYSYSCLIMRGALCSTVHGPPRPKTPTQDTHSRGKVTTWLWNGGVPGGRQLLRKKGLGVVTVRNGISVPRLQVFSFFFFPWHSPE